MNKLTEEEVKKDLEKIAEIPPVAEKTSNIAEDIRLIVKEWLDEKHIRYKTEYSSSGVAHAISLLQTIADRHKIKCIQDYLKNYRTDNLSIERQSSKELVDILKERIAEERKEEGMDKISKFLE